MIGGEVVLVDVVHHAAGGLTVVKFAVLHWFSSKDRGVFVELLDDPARRAEDVVAVVQAVAHQALVELVDLGLREEDVTVESVEGRQLFYVKMQKNV